MAKKRRSSIIKRSEYGRDRNRSRRTHTETRRPGATIHGFIAQIVAEGPNGENDFDDARYWVKKCAANNPRSRKPIDYDNAFAQMELDQMVCGAEQKGALGIWIMATNIAEITAAPAGIITTSAGSLLGSYTPSPIIGGAGGGLASGMSRTTRIDGGTHTLPIGTYVYARATQDANATPTWEGKSKGKVPYRRWWFIAYNGLGVQQFKLDTVGNDIVYGYTWDGETAGEELTKIAKPWGLRRTPFDGKTINMIEYSFNDEGKRLAKRGSDSELQVVIPPYHKDSLIYAVSNVQGGTDVVHENEPVSWLDLNVDARAWACEFLP